MKLVSVYQTDDGKNFATKDEAKTHEAECAAIKELGNILSASLRTGRPESIVREIILESVAVMAALTRHRKRLPRQKQQQKQAA